MEVNDKEVTELIEGWRTRLTSEQASEELQSIRRKHSSSSIAGNVWAAGNQMIFT